MVEVPNVIARMVPRGCLQTKPEYAVTVFFLIKDFKFENPAHFAYPPILFPDVNKRKRVSGHRLGETLSR